MKDKLYEYLIDNFPLECNSHNALKRPMNLGETVDDIAIFVMDKLCEHYHIKKGVNTIGASLPNEECGNCTNWETETLVQHPCGNMARCYTHNKQVFEDSHCESYVRLISRKPYAPKNRPSMPHIYMDMAFNIAKRSTCEERSVGCVVTSADFENVYSVGYNGTYPGGPNTCDHLGTKCGCVHAEENALMKCYVKDKNKVIFITLSPCQDCAKLILISGAKTVYYGEHWKDDPGITMLQSRGVECIYLEPTK